MHIICIYIMIFLIFSIKNRIFAYILESISLNIIHSLNPVVTYKIYSYGKYS